MNIESEEHFQRLLKDIAFEKEKLDDSIEEALKIAEPDGERMKKLLTMLEKTVKLIDVYKKQIQQRLNNFSMDCGQSTAGILASTNAIIDERTPRYNGGFLDRTEVAAFYSPQDNSSLRGEDFSLREQDSPRRHDPFRGQDSGVSMASEGAVLSHNDYPKSQLLFLSNIPRDASETDIHNQFARFGEILRVSLFPPRPPSSPVRSGCIVFLSPDHAKKAIGVVVRVRGQKVIGTQFLSREALQRREGHKQVAKEPVRFQVFLRGVPKEATGEFIHDVLNNFAKYKVKQLHLPQTEVTDRRNGGTCRIGYVAFNSQKDAENLLYERQIIIMGKEVACVRNTRSFRSIMDS